MGVKLKKIEKEYKFIIIRQDNFNGIPELFEGKPVYRIFNKKVNEQIGIISYYKQWKKYVFSTKEGIVFDFVCMNDIVHFMKIVIDD